MNFVLIMTDEQPKSMVGAYGNTKVDTPNLDQLASQGIRFERAYTACPICTPARGSILSGLHPQTNGAYCNNKSPSKGVPLMGTIFHHYGYRVPYTGKWHLEGGAYFGNGQPEGGFEPDWWYDGKNWAEDIGYEKFRKYLLASSGDDLREYGFDTNTIWGHRVADRAIDFLENVQKDENFALVVSFDEPHGPSPAPPEYWEKFSGDEIEKRPNFLASTANKPRLQQEVADPPESISWDEYAQSAFVRHSFGCNSFIDREIGRVVDAVDRRHGDDTVIFYTSDHGDMLKSHGLNAKGPEMYEEITNIPFIVRHPQGAGKSVSHSLVSHLDIVPTMLDLAGEEIPSTLHGKSLAPILQNPDAEVHDFVMINWHRCNRGDSHRGFYPIRCITDGRYKLAINLFDKDELYDTTEDPYELTNLIDDPRYAEIRDDFHDKLLAYLHDIKDPFRTPEWSRREWRPDGEESYTAAKKKKREKAEGFPFEHESLAVGDVLRPGDKVGWA